MPRKVSKKYPVWRHPAFPIWLLFTGSFLTGKAQSGIPPVDKAPSLWQRLALQQATIYGTAASEGVVDLDSSLIYSAELLSVSRNLILAEGLGIRSGADWVDQRIPAKGRSALSATNGKEHLRLLLLLGAYYAFEPGGYHRYRDSVDYFLNSARNESRSLAEPKLGRIALCLLGKFYAQAGETTRSDSIFQKLIGECQAAGDMENEARAELYSGLYTYFVPATSNSRIAALNSAVELFHSLHDDAGEIHALTALWFMHGVTYQLDSAVADGHRALDLEESIHFPYTHYTTDALAMFAAMAGKFGESLRYALQTVRTAEEAKDSIGWGIFYGRLGQLYLGEDSRREEAMKWFQRSISRLEKSGGCVTGFYITVGNAVLLLLRDKKTIEAYDLLQNAHTNSPPVLPIDQFSYHLAMEQCDLDLGRIAAAETEIDKADSIERSAAGHTSIAFVRGNLLMGKGLLYFAKGELKKARTFFVQSLADPSQFQFAKNNMNALHTIITIDSTLGDYASALKLNQAYDRMIDSSYALSTTRQAEELAVIYGLQEKNAQLKIEQADLQKATAFRNILIVGTALILIIAGLLYHQNRQRGKINKLIKEKNEALEGLVTEKEWLLKEIHHRVKNNLQTVVSLLGAQAAYLTNDALDAIRESQSRVYSISLIHQKLYQDEDVASIDMSLYLPELVTYLQDIFQLGQQIRFTLDIAPVRLDVSQAVPVALILNEAITNAIKHAFAVSRSDNTISITLEPLSPDLLELCISDNGAGFPSTMDFNKTKTMGMRLIRGLAGDLGGTIGIRSDHGVEVRIRFKLHPLTERT